MQVRYALHYYTAIQALAKASIAIGRAATVASEERPISPGSALEHSGAPTLGRSGTQALRHSGTQALRHSGAPALGHSGTRRTRSLRTGSRRKGAAARSAPQITVKV